MGTQIYQYKNEHGAERFAARTSVTDRFLIVDANREQLTEWWGERAKQNAIFEIQLYLERFDDGIRYLFVSDSKKDLIDDIKFHLKECDGSRQIDKSLEVLLKHLKSGKKNGPVSDKEA